MVQLKIHIQKAKPLECASLLALLSSKSIKPTVEGGSKLPHSKAPFGTQL